MKRSTKKLIVMMMTMVLMVAVLSMGAFAVCTTDACCSHAEADHEAGLGCWGCHPNWSGMHEYRPAATVDCTPGKPVTTTTPATCTVDGSEVTTISCTECGDVIRTTTETLTAPGHSLDENTNTCACGYHEHLFSIAVNGTAPTCTETGIAPNAKCAYCGALENDETVVPATGHTPGDVQIEKPEAPTCTKEGRHSEVVYCTECDVELKRDDEVIDPKLPHTPGEAADENYIAPTCENGGSVEHVVRCTVCKEELDSVVEAIDALGHKWDAGKVTKEPTATQKGEKLITCENDPTHTKTEEIAALGTAGMDDVPKTGDVSAYFMIGGMMIVALIGVSFFSAKKRNEN